MHGGFDDGTSWFRNIDISYSVANYGAYESDLPLPLKLLEMGYDVWVGNMRGTQYSRGHTTLDSSNPQSAYWDFNFAQKGMLDVPATIEKIKEVSGVEKVAYAGYSTGSTIMFYALS